IVLGVASSSDSRYTGMKPPNVAVTNFDDDTAGFRITHTGDLVTSEDGASVTFEVVLSSRPTTDVILGLRSSNLDEANASPSMLFFNPDNWDQPQQITVDGADDQSQDGDHPY